MYEGDLLLSMIVKNTLLLFALPLNFLLVLFWFGFCPGT